MNKDFDVNELIAAEEELQTLKQQHEPEQKEAFWKRLVEAFIERKESRKPVKIGKKKYCLTALLGGWLGIHCFMVGKKVQGVIYLLLSFTGFSFAMSILDIWYAAFLKADENHCIAI